MSHPPSWKRPWPKMRWRVWWKNLKAAWARPPWRGALVLAVVSDIISFGTAWVAPAQWAIDALTAVALFVLLGFRWKLLIPLVIEAVPGLAVFPTWTLALLAFAAIEEEAPSGATKGDPT